MILAFTGHKYSGKNTVATIVEEAVGRTSHRYLCRTELRSIETDETIVNDSTLDALEQNVRAKLRRIIPDEGL